MPLASGVTLVLCRDRRDPRFIVSRSRHDAETTWSRGGSFEHGLRVALDLPPEDHHRATIPTSRTVRRW